VDVAFSNRVTRRFDSFCVMFGNMHPIEKGKGRDEVEGPQLQAQYSHPRDDVPVNTYDYALDDASVPRTTHDTGLYPSSLVFIQDISFYF
jgi:hypothetical protein